MDRLSSILGALAHPTRRAILMRLRAGEASVKELAAPFAMSGPAISKHLAVLERAGLIRRGRNAQWRPCRLDPKPIREVAEWAGVFRPAWEASYDRLDLFLEQLRKIDGYLGQETRERPRVRDQAD
jgi:DNA-binding transcriptional ArsR family regulator